MVGEQVVVFAPPSALSAAHAVSNVASTVAQGPPVTAALQVSCATCVSRRRTTQFSQKARLSDAAAHAGPLVVSTSARHAP